MVNVGTLAALVNVAALLLLTITERVVHSVLCLFSWSREAQLHPSPTISDRDTSLLNIPTSLIKFSRYPGLFLTVVCALLFLTADIATEFGVSSATNCTPETRRGNVSISTDTSNTEWGKTRDLVLGRIALISQIQSIEFFEADWTLVPSGFPADMRPSVCISCLSPPERPAMLANCTLRDGRTYEAGEIEVGLRKLSNSLLNTVSVGFNETAENGKYFFGDGDLVKQNLDRCAIFVTHIDEVANASGSTVTYFEYSFDDHCEEMLLTVGGGQEETNVWFPTQGRTYTQELVCNHSAVLPATLREAITLYRTVQLEYALRLHEYLEDEQRFAKLTLNDIFRAVLASMLANTQFAKDKEYYEYSECGRYDWIFVMPFIASIGLLAFLGALAMVLARKNGAVLFGGDKGRAQNVQRVREAEESQMEQDASFPALRSVQAGVRHSDADEEKA